jgi:hypothetical protein
MKGIWTLDIEIDLIFFCFHNCANNNRDKYLRGEGDSDSYLLTNLMVPYLLQVFFRSIKIVSAGKGI